MRTIARPPSLWAPSLRGQPTRTTSPRAGPRLSAAAPGTDTLDEPDHGSRICRVALPGAQLRVLVLATTPDGSVGIDLDSGAFVRALHRPCLPALRTLDVVAAELAGPPDPPDESRPEAVELQAGPRLIGRLGRRRAGRYFEALTHPAQGPLLGFSGTSVPFWTLCGDRPSLALVTPEVGPQLRWTQDGLVCRFAWQGLVHQLPLQDTRLATRMTRQRRSTCSGRDLARLAGYRPGRLLVMLAPPVEGYCHKQVSAVLPA